VPARRTYSPPPLRLRWYGRGCPTARQQLAGAVVRGARTRSSIYALAVCMGSPSVLIIIIRTLRDLLSTRSIIVEPPAVSGRRGLAAVAAATPAVSLCLQATAAPGYP
jgi:hypothetical protein